MAEIKQLQCLAYCTKLYALTTTSPVVDTRSNNSWSKGADAESARFRGFGAYALKRNIWSKDRLTVFFINSDHLGGCNCGSGGPLNTTNILQWANLWNDEECKNIPDFQQTYRPENADIRVEFKEDGDCWSRVGIHAENVPKSEPTMVLSLKGRHESEQQFLVVHEFGHALGLFHEHQRYDFWEVAKNFLDVDKMKRDHGMRGVNFERDMFFKESQGATAVSEYDEDSVMHYWFDINWLKYTKHQTLEGVESDSALTDNERKILRGIHKRDRNTAKRPSRMDRKVLQQLYSGTKRKTPPSAANPAEPPPTSSTDRETEFLFKFLDTTMKALQS